MAAGIGEVIGIYLGRHCMALTIAIRNSVRLKQQA